MIGISKGRTGGQERYIGKTRERRLSVRLSHSSDGSLAGSFYAGTSSRLGCSLP